MSRLKEPRYFNRTVDASSHFTRPIAGGSDYLSLWNHCADGQLIGEVTPTYFHDPATPRVLKEAIPEVKVVVSVRNPVDRAVSHFYFKEKRTGRSSTSLSDAIDLALQADQGDYRLGYLLEPGFYGRHLSRWLEYFDRSDIHLIVFEEFAQSFEKSIADLLVFLGMSADAARGIERTSRNSAAIPRGPGAARLLQSSALRSVIRTLGVERLAVTAGKLLLLENADYPEPDSADLERLLGIYRSDIQAFEKVSGLDTGWLGS